MIGSCKTNEMYFSTEKVVHQFIQINGVKVSEADLH